MSAESDEVDGEAVPDSRLAANGIQVISRAASILRALRDEPDGLSLGRSPVGWSCRAQPSRGSCMR